jgi:hypothetical protein
VPRTWGYIIVVLAAFVGAGALLLPVPEEIEVERVETPPAAPPKPARPTPPSPAASRTKKPAVAPPPAPPPATKPDAAPATRPFPMQDTTKTRTMVQPKPPEN